MPTLLTTAMNDIPAYDPVEVEARWRERWRAMDTSGPPVPGGGRSIYLLPIFPSPAGQLHIRQVRIYTFADTWARYRRARGDEVLFSIGFDSFTMFVEAAAVRSGVDPRRLSALAQAQIRTQLDLLAISFDWSRSFRTSDENMYRWSQWLFLKLLERGLVFRANALIDWCDACEAALAASLVRDGCCWRCERPVRRVERPQWFVRMAPYLTELYDGIDGLTGWEVEQTRQRSLFGKTEGVEVDLSTPDGQRLTAFTPYPGAVGGAGFVALAPDHPGVTAWCPAAARGADDVAGRSTERHAEQLSVIKTGIHLTVAGISRPLPVIISATVLHRFGGGAMLGVPGVDATDAVIARRLGLEVPDPVPPPPELVLRPAVRYRIGDFPISRQRFWGAPIPIVHCPACGIVPVPEAELPVVLPSDLRPAVKGNPLANHPSFRNCTCPACGGAAARECDTLDGRTDGVWHWIVPCIPSTDRAAAIFEHPDLRRWLPVEQVIWTESRSEDLLDIRFVTRVLRDLGVLEHVAGGEPFRNVLVTGALSIDESKAQKGLEDVADPGSLVRRFGADCLRLALLHAISPRKDFRWTGASLVECRRFLRDVWSFILARLADLVHRGPDTPGADSPDQASSRLRVWRETALAKITANLDGMEFHSAVRNVMLLFQRIQQFDTAARRHGETLPGPARAVFQEAVATLLCTLAPMTPHFAAELWERCGGGPALAVLRWPSPADALGFSDQRATADRCPR